MLQLYMRKLLIARAFELLLRRTQHPSAVPREVIIMAWDEAEQRVRVESVKLKDEGEEDENG